MNKKLFSTLAVTTVIATTFTPVSLTEASTTFTDVAPNTELADAVYSLVDRGVISGMGDGTYRPDQPITRGQAAKILAGALNITKGDIDYAYFDDVPEDHPFAKHIYALADNNIVNNFVENFNPDQLVTRSQMAKMISGAYRFYNDLEVPFVDVKNEEDLLYVGRLYNAGITKGISDTLFGVKNPVTRGQMAIFINRAEKAVADAKLIFKAEDFGQEYVRGGILYHYSDEILETFGSDLYSENQWYGFQAYRPGTAYIYVGGFDQGTDGGLGDLVSYYKLDVTEQNGRLVIDQTLLDEPMYDPEYLHISKDIDFTFTYVDGEEVPEELIHIEDDGDMYTVTLLTGEAELLAHYVYEDGSDYTFAIDYKVSPPYSMYTTGKYIPEEYVITKEELEYQYGFTSIQSVEAKPYVNAWDEELENAVESVSIVNGDLHIKIKGEGTSTIWITDEEGYTYDMFFSPNKFGDGYFIEE